MMRKGLSLRLHQSYVSLAKQNPFLKLLEGQLIKFHNDNKLDYSFMNIDKIKGFDDLNELFFEVLALPEKPI